MRHCRFLVILLMLLLSAACTVVSPPQSTAPAIKSITPTPTVKTPVATLIKSTNTPPVATASPSPSGPIPTLDTLRRTPPTIMLHRSNPQFDSVAFLKDLVKILQKEKLKVITYEDITRQPDITALEAGHLFIITIDDIGLQAPLDPSIEQMITILQDAGYPAVLGIITEGKLPDEQTAARLKELSASGWELAMHTDTHVNLNELARDMPYAVRLEIRTCREKILAATGISANTLVLPYGDNVADLKILYREKVAWTVGIGGGTHYRTTNWTYYVGREGPAGDAQTTFDILMERFNSVDS